MKRITIIGAGELGLQFFHFISECSNDQIVGWFDDTKNKGEFIAGKEVLGAVEDIKNNRNLFDSIAIAIGYNHLEFKYQLLQSIKNKIPLYTFIHPTAIIDKTSIIQEGCFIFPNVVVDKSCIIKSGSILNNSVTVSHNSVIGECSFLAPGCILSGLVTIDSFSFLGIGTIVIDNINIASYIRTGGGTVVIKDLEKKGLYVGNPARFIR